MQQLVFNVLARSCCLLVIRGHSQPRLYPYSLDVKDSITGNYSPQCKLCNSSFYTYRIYYLTQTKEINCGISLCDPHYTGKIRTAAWCLQEIHRQTAWHCLPQIRGWPRRGSRAASQAGRRGHGLLHLTRRPSHERKTSTEPSPAAAKSNHHQINFAVVESNLDAAESRHAVAELELEADESSLGAAGHQASVQSRGPFCFGLP
jgi:hypothetical protein